ncbi:phytochelatin synthase family protein [Sandaracinus amylolyticus]|uniref:glutathione gamma-glutamylcysteinyltransferase n=1 Tax=Sandaracinus amylolyticus TaxID=927083 RepID=A0A0F6SH78_9BACT|nr:phytochelatin synthase family protein [Sandaracinus amylolyticus]AKF09969.1 Phytochelatin synthase [Sandaracinus amylolyticus]
MSTPRRRRAITALAAILTLSIGGGGLAFLRARDASAAQWAHVDPIADDTTYQDAALLERAWQLPAARHYRARFVSQPNGSFCGPTSIVDVMRSLDQPAELSTVLEGTDIATFAGFLPSGITLDQLATLARARLPSRRVTIHRDFDLATFRALLAQHANSESDRIVVNFHRGPLFARGAGHHSPIGGYLPDDDLVFVLDVNDDYDPWLVPTERLFAAMDTVDGASGLERGLIVIESVE